MTTVIIKNNERIIDTHSLLVGYILWIFGFMGVHRFYYGKPITGTIWFFTGGLLGVGWIIDAFLIPAMDRQADMKYWDGPVQYPLAWGFLVFFGFLGVHKFYMEKYLIGVLYFFSGGFFVIGVLYDLWTLNDQINEHNKSSKAYIG